MASIVELTCALALLGTGRRFDANVLPSYSETDHDRLLAGGTTKVHLKADVFFSALRERQRASDVWPFALGFGRCRELSSYKDQELQWRGISAWISQPPVDRHFAIIDTAHP